MTTKAAIKEVMSFLGKRNTNNDARRANLAKARAAKATKHSHAGSGTYTTNSGIQARPHRTAARRANLPGTSTLCKQEEN